MSTEQSKHTPGEWKWEGSLLRGPDGTLILWPDNIPGNLEDDAPANLLMGADTTAEAAEANRLLIAAAPDLLAACRKMIEMWESTSDESINLMHRSDVDNLARGAIAIRAAIAKAEGKARR